MRFLLIIAIGGLAGCAGSNVALLSSGQETVVDGEKIYVAKARDEGMWAATSAPRLTQPNPIATKVRYVLAIERITGCMVSEAVYDQALDRVDALVSCKR